MKTIIKITTGLTMTLCLCSLAGYAQQTPMYTHYMYNTLVVNPAYAGSREALTITALHRSQWTDFKGAPKTSTITVHAPVRYEHIGLGLSVMNDRIGPSSNTSLNAHFAFRMQLSQKSKLALGLTGGADINQADLTELNIDEPDDPAFSSNVNNSITPNFGAGAYYSRERFYTGFSVPNLLQNAYSETGENGGNALIPRQQRHYFFIAGAMLNLSHGLAFKPTTLIKVTAAAPSQIDLTASFIIKKRLLLGAMFRSGDAFGALVGLNIAEQFYLGYSYDFSYGLRTFQYNQGSHEIVLRYDFIFPSKRQVHTPRHF